MFAEPRRGEPWTPAGHGEGLESHVEPLVLVQDEGDRHVHGKWVVRDRSATPSLGFIFLQYL